MSPSITLDPTALAALALAGTRVFAWMQFVPVFSGPSVPKAVRAALALGVGLAVSPSIHLRAVPGWPMFIADIASQALIGAAFGVITSFLLNAVASAGDTLDLFGGLVLPQSLQPIGFRTTTTVGQLYSLATIAILVVTHGDLLLLRGLVTTFGVLGPTLSLLLPMAHGAITAVATFFTATFEIAGPLLVVEFVVQVGLGLVAKAAPNVNIFLFAFAVQAFVLILVLGLGTSILPSAVHRLVQDAIHLEGQLL